MKFEKTMGVSFELSNNDIATILNGLNYSDLKEVISGVDPDIETCISDAIISGTDSDSAYSIIDKIKKKFPYITTRISDTSNEECSEYLNGIDIENIKKVIAGCEDETRLFLAVSLREEINEIIKHCFTSLNEVDIMKALCSNNGETVTTIHVTPKQDDEF